MFQNESFWFVLAKLIQSVVGGVWDSVLSSGTLIVKSKSFLKQHISFSFKGNSLEERQFNF